MFLANEIEKSNICVLYQQYHSINSILSFNSLGSILENKDDSQWHFKQVTIEAGKSQISFTGVRGEAYQGDIALDDIIITDGQCS